ncbi:predicted protein [Sclerotinia sclerotiorum 1980 UF-70]|uniref:Uncharacterized protein n=1 Tax=Sclerotinia sclerotiorum (strain ATCC 18683 / 1980 / Ss-1) TaxID=665079 RepID=A7EG52_SCLS1|nr:predicted protein [Sclerotinia sclerotiorum 1980 UF-70]EDO01818.1 predicted protein [Sclerotinia sclerotiorum 1980 UF-70]
MTESLAHLSPSTITPYFTRLSIEVVQGSGIGYKHETLISTFLRSIGDSPTAPKAAKLEIQYNKQWLGVRMARKCL